MSRFAIGVLLVAVAASSLFTRYCERKRDPRLSLTFDGGFAFVTNQDGSVSVVVPREDSLTSATATPHVAPTHEAFLKIETGIVTIPAQGLPPITAGGWSLNGYVVQIRAGQASGADVELPTYSDEAQDDQTCADIPNQGPKANNSKWLVDMSDLHAAPPTVDASTASTIVGLSGGRLDVGVATGCWQLTRNDGTPSPERRDGQSMVYGDDSMIYRLLGGAGDVTFALVPMAGSGLDPITIDVRPPNGGHVQARIAYPPASHPPSQSGEQMTDFLRFYKLFPRVAETEAFVPVALINHKDKGAKPGRECASVRMAVN